jgi:ribosomal protein S27AE
MQLHVDAPAGSSRLAVMPFFQRPACPRCGDTMFAATATEYFGRGFIRHSWSCEVCQHEFQTAVELPPHLQ